MHCLSISNKRIASLLATSYFKKSTIIMLYFHVGFTRGSGTSWLPRDSGSKGETMMDKLHGDTWRESTSVLKGTAIDK